MVVKDKNAITGTFVNDTSGKFPSYMTFACMTTQRQGKAAR
jgi:hypothetical protein